MRQMTPSGERKDDHGGDEIRLIAELEEKMAPEYRLYIRRHEFETLEQLTRMATEYESVRHF